MATQLTDQQLMLLEQLTYLTSDIEVAAGLPGSGGTDSLKKGNTVADLLNRFSDKRIAELESKGEELGLTHGSEWAAIIRQIKSDPELMTMKMADKGPNGTYCLLDSQGQAVVIFRGTYDGDEWHDNFLGLGTADTEEQIKALDYIESLPYNDITAVGHSKGGNKSMYVSILSDKVCRAVSMDGQGFSQEFLDKYAAEIKRNAHKAINYSLDGDYVHIWMYQLENVRQIYLKPNEYVNGAKYHCPANLLYFKKEGDQWIIEMNEEGMPALHETDENQSMTYLHDFSCFVLEVCPIEDRQEIGNYLGRIMACLMRDNYHFVDEDGVTYSHENLQDYIFKHTECLSKVVAFLMKYVETYNVTEEHVWALLAFMGLDETVRKIKTYLTVYEVTHPIEAVKIKLLEKGVIGLLEALYAQLHDKKRDPILEQFLEWLNGWLSESLGVQLNLPALWKSIEKEYTAIGTVDMATGQINTTNNTFRVFDYSTGTYDALTRTMNRIDAVTVDAVNSWSQVYGLEEWYNDLGIALFTSGINGYSQKLADINDNCRRQAATIFENVMTIDSTQAQKVSQINAEIDNIRQSFQELAGRIG